jgi:hypothetical protein
VVVPLGALQLENGLQLSDDGGRNSFDLPETEIRYGLLQKTELRLNLPDYFHNLPASGFADLTLGIKQQLGPLAGFDFSLIPSLSVPTGAAGVSSHGYDPGLQLPWSHGLTGNLTVAGQLASYWPTVDGRHDRTAEATLLFDRQLSAPWDAWLEYAGDFPARGGARQLLHTGTAYKLTAHQQLDLHAALGLSAAAPRWFIGCGYSYLLLPR